MFKKTFSKAVALTASALTLGSAAHAGGVSDAIEETEIAPVVVEEPSGSLSVWSIVGLLALGAVIAVVANQDDDDDDEEEVEGPILKKPKG